MDQDPAPFRADRSPEALVGASVLVGGCLGLLAGGLNGALVGHVYGQTYGAFYGVGALPGFTAGAKLGLLAGAIAGTIGAALGRPGGYLIGGVAASAIAPVLCGDSFAWEFLSRSGTVLFKGGYPIHVLSLVVGAAVSAIWALLLAHPPRRLAPIWWLSDILHRSTVYESPLMHRVAAAAAFALLWYLSSLTRLGDYSSHFLSRF
jgi:hypothetical protein